MSTPVRCAELRDAEMLIAVADKVAQPIQRVPHVHEASGDRREAEPDAIRATEVGQHARVFDQRLDDLGAVAVPQRDVRTAADRVPR